MTDRITLTCITFLLPFLSSAQVVIDVNDPPMEGVLSIHFWDADTGIASGLGGIMRTTDGAETWSFVAQVNGWSGSLRFSADGQHGICAMTDSVLFTHDAGLTWSRSELPPATWADDVGISSPQIMFFDATSLYRTLDGGQTWGLGAPMNSFICIDPVDDQLAYCATVGDLWRSTDGGLNWNLVHEDFPEILLETCFVDELHGWVSGYDGYIAYTEDGGVTWTTQNNLGLGEIATLEMLPSGLGLAGYRNYNDVDPLPVLMTVNGGADWTTIALVDEWVRCVSLTPEAGYYIDSEGDLRRIDLPIGVAEHGAARVRIAPNPAHDRLTVQLNEVAAELWWMELMDLSGRVVRAQYNSGAIGILDRGDLVTGNYILRVRTREQSFAQQVRFQ